MSGRNRRPAKRKYKRRPQQRRGGYIDPGMVDKGLNILANLIIPAIIYGGASYGIYRAVK